MTSDGLRLESHASISHWLAGVMAGENPVKGWPHIQESAINGACGAKVVDLAEILATDNRFGISNEGNRKDNPTLYGVESERVRLFETAAGGIPAPPYGSWWLDGRLVGPSTTEVAAIYLEFGLKPGFGPADHISAELEFLHVLIQHQLADGDPKGEKAKEVERVFIRQFMAPWIQIFADATNQASSDLFWIAVVDLIECVVTAEHARVAS